MRAGDTHESAREKGRKGTAKPMCHQQDVKNEGPNLIIQSGSTAKLERQYAWESQTATETPFGNKAHPKIIRVAHRPEDQTLASVANRTRAVQIKP